MAEPKKNRSSPTVSRRLGTAQSKSVCKEPKNVHQPQPLPEKCTVVPEEILKTQKEDVLPDDD